MASPSITCFSFQTILFLSITTTLFSSVAFALEFTVGGPAWWTVPSTQNPDFYNHWVNSVLVVSSIFKYMQCNTTYPIQEIPAANTVFCFTRYEFYYFISGQVAHCVASQRMIVRVMVHSNPDSISPSLSPALSPSDEAAAPSGYYNEPASSASPTPSSSGSMTHYHNVSSAAKVGAGYGSLGVIGALLVIGL